MPQVGDTVREAVFGEIGKIVEIIEIQDDKVFIVGFPDGQDCVRTIDNIEVIR